MSDCLRASEELQAAVQSFENTILKCSQNLKGEIEVLKADTSDMAMVIKLDLADAKTALKHDLADLTKELKSDIAFFRQSIH